MGNCQAVDAAALVIQHPDGKLERLYWPTPASEVMKMNPGHYVTLIIPLPISDQQEIKPRPKPNPDRTTATGDTKTIRFTRVKLLRPTDMLVLGRAYRLVTTQEVMRVLREKKIAKMSKQGQEAEDSLTNIDQYSQRRDPERNGTGSGHREGSRKPEVEVENNDQEMKDDKGRAVGRSRSWRPALQSISESAT